MKQILRVKLSNVDMELLAGLEPDAGTFTQMKINNGGMKIHVMQKEEEKENNLEEKKREI